MYNIVIALNIILMIPSSIYTMYTFGCQESNTDTTPQITTSVKEDKEKQSGSRGEQFTPTKFTQTDTAAEKEDLPPSYFTVFNNTKL